MRILVIGAGGREHAICWKIAQSKKADKIYCAPANGGISRLAEPVAIAADDIKGLADFAASNKIGLTVVGPEAPLVKGITDVFQEKGLRIFGPSRSASRLEASKIFAKEMMRRWNVPTAAFEEFNDYKKARSYVEQSRPPFVVKADGLAAGKGVSVCHKKDEAFKALDEAMVHKRFGSAGEKVIIEECLEGEEASVIVISDGKNVAPLAASQDHKRVFDGDKGENTGGMGAYSPAPVITPEEERRIMSEVIMPVINGMAADGVSYKGVLYAGIMVTREGPKVLEFNVRFGDPETQAVLPRLKSDLVDLMERSIDGGLKGYSPVWDKKSAACVVMTSGGYPGKYEKGKKIKGLGEAEKIRDAAVFHAGTKKAPGGGAPDGYLTDGGRVLAVTGLGDTIESAIKKSYEAVSKISFDGMHFRRDIGKKALSRPGVIIGN